MHAQSTGGLFLLFCTIVALAWKNSAWGPSYDHLWELRLTVGLDGWSLSKSLHHWINDALMGLFFFVVGLEIKRNVVVGELSSPSKALVPFAAAIGGMVVPIAIYWLVASGSGNGRGWAIPMATDIAFALGILALLGPRIPIGLKVFLTALAIVDDIGGVLVIALFYAEKIAWTPLLIAAGLWITMIGSNSLGIRRPLPYFLLGTALWLCFLKSGVHPTVAGMLGALTIPVRTKINEKQFAEKCRQWLDHFELLGRSGAGALVNAEQRAVFKHIETLNAQAQSPLHRLEHSLHPWVSFGVMPIFALANAGLDLGGSSGENWVHPVSIGIAVGLAGGKFLGVFGATWLVVRSGLCKLPSGVGWNHIAGAAILAGVGFTMSLFISGLAFGSDAELVARAKSGILMGSIVSGLVGYAVLYRTSPLPPPESVAPAEPAAVGPNHGSPA